MKPDLILTADWHLRDDVPRCRTDDFQTAQRHKIRCIRDLQAEHGCPVVVAGDVFDRWQGFSGRTDHSLISWAISHLPASLYIVPGQHDLPYHSHTAYSKSALAVLERAGVAVSLCGGRRRFERPLRILQGAGFGMTPPAPPPAVPGARRVLVWHTFTWRGRIPWPGCQATAARRLQDKYPQYDLIVTGDNHKPFVSEWKGRLLVNPGSLMRTTADQADHEPRVYLWFAKRNEVKPVFLPVKKGVISREHIQTNQQRSARLDRFVNQLVKDEQHSVDFVENMKRWLEDNPQRKETRDLIWEGVESV